jgi:2-methylaconitate cis-trans-isomerase PrpF
MQEEYNFMPKSDLSSIEQYKALGSLLGPIMGSPDNSERQLDGLGGGISSLSKIIVYERDGSGEFRQDSRGHLVSDSTVKYTFIQVGITDGQLDLSGNCGMF